MTLLRVDGAAGSIDTPLGLLPCTIGRGGIVPNDAKREGDGATPAGRWPIRGALLRPDRLAAPTATLPWRWLRPGDGWSDDVGDPAYNRPVSHPRRFGAERLWRDDSLYDIIVVLGHNDDPPTPGRGSAIFFHVAPARGATEGCIAIARDAMIALLPLLAPGDAVAIS